MTGDRARRLLASADPGQCPAWCETGDAETHLIWDGAHHAGTEVRLARYPDDAHQGRGYLGALLIQEAAEDAPSVLISLPPSARAVAEMRLNLAEATEVAAALTALCRAAGPRRPVSYLRPVPPRQGE